MGYEVTARAPRAPIIQPRPRAIPADFTAANIRIMLATRVGIGRDADFPTLAVAGVQTLTSEQARDILATLGTSDQVVDQLTDQQAIDLADTLVPIDERTAAAKPKTSDITKVPITTKLGSPSTSKTSAGSITAKTIPTTKAAAAAAAETLGDYLEKAAAELGTTGTVAKSKIGTVLKQTAKESTGASTTAKTTAGTIIKQTAAQTTAAKTTPEKPKDTIVKLKKLAEEEEEAKVKPVTIPVLHARTGRSILSVIQYDPAVGDPNPFILFGTPIPFPCVITNLALIFAGFIATTPALQLVLDLLPGGQAWQGVGRDSGGLVVPGVPETDSGGGYNIPAHYPMHFLCSTPGTVPRATAFSPGGLGAPGFSITLTCDEVDLSRIDPRFLRPNAEQNPTNVARQGTANPKRSRPIKLTA